MHPLPRTLLAALLLCPMWARAETTLSVRTNDGLALGLDAHGAIQSVTVDGAALPLFGAGGFFVSEVLPDETPLPMDGATRVGTPLLGLATATGANQVTVSGILDAQGVKFTAVLSGGPALHLALRLESTRARDRAFVTYFRVPVDATSGQWSSALGSSRTLTAGTRAYDPFNWFQDYRTTTSASPLATVTTGGTALALAIPPTAPAIYRLTYQSPYGFQVEWEAGTAPDTARFSSAAQVEALLYRADAQWAFRAALKRLYLLYPDLWTRRAADGSWFLDEGTLASVANPQDFAIRFSETNDWASAFTRSNGIYALKYTEPWNDHLETDPAGLQGWAQDTAANQVMSLFSKGEPREVTAQAALLSATIGRDGQYGGFGDPANFTDPEGTARYVLNPDWEIPNFLGFTAQAAGLAAPLDRGAAVEEYEMFRRWGVQPQGPGDAYDGLYLDSVDTAGNGWSGWHLFNFRREHFATTRAMLVFDPQSGRVALSQALSSLESVRHLAGIVHQRGGLVMANGLPDPFVFTTAAYCDFVSPGERYDGTLADLRQMRAASYTKPMSFLYDDQVSDAQFQHALLYAVFPGGAGLEQNRAVYQRWAPVMLEVAAAGWEPLTFAHSDDPGVLVERYGRLDQGTLHFVAHRESGSAGASQLVLDKAALGIGAGVRLAARDIASGASVAVTDSGDTVQLALDLSLEQSAAIALTATAGTPGPTAGETLPPAPAAPPGDAGTGTGGSGAPPPATAGAPGVTAASAGGCATGGGASVLALLAFALVASRLLATGRLSRWRGRSGRAEGCAAQHRGR